MLRSRRFGFVAFLGAFVFIAQAMLSGSASAQTSTPTATATATITTLQVATTGTDSAGCGASASPCKTISQAVTNAASGSTIAVSAGTYREMVTISKPLTLVGTQAIIDATALVNGFLVKSGADGTNISGFTVQKAIGEGILLAQVSRITINNNTITGNDLGAGTSATMECQNQGSVPGDCGEGLHLMTVANSNITNNTITGNEGGILVTDELGPTHDNVIANNNSSNNKDDCGITLPSHNGKALSSTGQRQPDQGGVFNNRVEGNTVNGNGGAGVGMFAPFPGTASYNNIVTNNTMSGNGNAGVSMHSHAPNQDLNGNTITNNKIDRNNVAGDPDAGVTQTAGIIISSVVVPVTGVTISGNQISNDTFGIWTTANVSTAGAAGNTFTNVTTQLQQAPPAAAPGAAGAAAPAPPKTGAGVTSAGNQLGAQLVLVLLVLCTTGAVIASRARTASR